MFLLKDTQLSDRGRWLIIENDRNYISSLTECTLVTSLHLISLSTVVLNSRDRHENVWFLKNMRLEKQPF